jgi:arginine:ornithine antiporter/lysine permease
MKKKLGFYALISLVMGSMIGEGIFSLPQNMARSASGAGIMLGWAITFTGMLCLAFVFQMLSKYRPKIQTGIQGYAQGLFGNYVGSQAVWGYWLSAMLGNVSYLLALNAAFAHFDVFAFLTSENGEHMSWYGLAFCSFIMWFFYMLILRGVQKATLLNTLFTVAKIIPITVFIFVAMYFFSVDTFVFNFSRPELGSLFEQTKSTMLATVWCFIGIEGATVYATKAESQKDVGKATVVGFLMTLVLLMLVSMLPLGSIAQEEIATMATPSMSSIFKYLVGSWGMVFINIAIIISIAGALLAWILLATEAPFLAATEALMPKGFTKQNKEGVPVYTLLTVLFIMQIFLVISFFKDAIYQDAFMLSSAMILIPYLLSALFGVKVTLQEKAMAVKYKILAFVASIYGFWLLYAADLKFVLFSTILYAIGLGFYAYSRKTHGKLVFENKQEKYLAMIVMLLAVYATYLWFTELA